MGGIKKMRYFKCWFAILYWIIYVTIILAIILGIVFFASKCFAECPDYSNYKIGLNVMPDGLEIWVWEIGPEKDWIIFQEVGKPKRRIDEVLENLIKELEKLKGE